MVVVSAIHKRKSPALLSSWNAHTEFFNVSSRCVYYLATCPIGHYTSKKIRSLPIQIIAFGEGKKSLNMHVSLTILHRGAIIECFGLSITRFRLFDCIMLNFEGVSPILDSRNKIKIKYQKCFNAKCFDAFFFLV